MMRGRRQIADDMAALLLMVDFNRRLVDRGEEPNDRAAARMARLALDLPGASAAAIEDRLRAKFRARRVELMAGAEFSPNKSQASPGGREYLKSARSSRG